MNRDYKLYLNDLQESIKQIEEYTRNVSEESFKKDKKLQDAVMRRLEIIGEAVKNVPRSLKEKNKDFPWTEISQFRDFIIHSYYEVSLNRVWKTIKERLPEIKQELNSISLV